MNMRYALLVCILLVGLSGLANADYVYDPADFATEVVSYIAGTGAVTGFTTPGVALDRPTVDTVGDGQSGGLAPVPFPVTPFYPAYRTSELVSIGYDGQLVVKFSRKVYDNPYNPYGIDFIIFGNSMQTIDGSDYYRYTDPTQTTVGLNATSMIEPGTVSVSQDGITWYTFTAGPFADAFAPTLGRVYDPDNPDPSLNSYAWTNEWWGRPTDPTVPLDPALTFDSFKGKTVAEVAELYGNSAGGTGFDIGALGLDWIQYVRVQNFWASGFTPEIDAFSIVRPVPEPATLALLGVATGMLLAGRGRRRR